MGSTINPPAAILANVASNANQSLIVPCELHEQVRFIITMAGTGDPAGAFTFTGSVAGDRFAALNVTDSILIGGYTGSTITWSSSTPNIITLADPASVAIEIGFFRPPPRVKVAWVPTGASGHTSGMYIDTQLFRF